MDQKRDLVKTWHDIQARLSDARPSRRRGTSKLFAEYAWDTFDPREVVAILATSDESYYAHKDILYDGFCAWSVAPCNPRLPKQAMVLRTALCLDAAEKAGRATYGNVGRLGDIIIRTHYVDPEFFDEIYYPIGGILGISKTISRRSYQTKLSKFTTAVNCTIKVIKIYHYHVENLLPSKLYRKPSLNSTAPILDKVFIYEPEPPGERIVKEHWRQTKDAGIFLYAASTIDGGNGLTLFDLMMTGKTTWRRHGHLFPQWISRAHYIAEEIMSKCAETNTAKNALSILPECKNEIFPAPTLDALQSRAIIESFEK